MKLVMTGLHRRPVSPKLFATIDSLSRAFEKACRKKPNFRLSVHRFLRKPTDEAQSELTLLWANRPTRPLIGFHCTEH